VVLEIVSDIGGFSRHVGSDFRDFAA